MLRSKFKDVDIPENVSLPEFLLQYITKHGSKVALINGITGSKMTFAEVKVAVERVSAALYADGMRKGDVVMLCSPNCVEYPLVVMAALSLGAILSTSNPLYIVDELANQMADCGATYLIADESCAGKMKVAAIKHGKVKRIYCFGTASGCVSFEHLLKTKARPAPRVTFDPLNDAAFLPYSSGTTGSPKGVILTHHNVISNLVQCQQPELMSPQTGNDVYLCVLPMYHIYGLVVLNFFSLVFGDPMVVLPKFDLVDYLSCIQKHKVSVLHIVPPIVLLLAKHPLVSEYDTSSVHTLFSGAAPLGEKLGKEAMARLKVNCVRQGFGMTETSPVTHLSPQEGWKHGSVGVVIPNTECKVVHLETGAILGPMEDGEICVRGPQVMKGYLNKPEATAHTIDSEGWLHTGDIGHYDEDEMFYIVDRLKELIKFKGLQVAPADLESLLLSHPAVADVGVIGLPDDEAGELPRAYVVLKPGQEGTSGQTLQDFVAGQVSPHKKLRGGVVFLKEIPKSASGKILRRELKQMARDELKTAKSKL